MRSGILANGKVLGIESEQIKVKMGNALNYLLLQNHLLLLIVAFLLGRASAFESIIPFGIAIYTATYKIKMKRFFLAGSIIIGTLTGGSFEVAYMTIASMFLFNALAIIPINKKKNKGGNYEYLSAAFISTLIPNLFIVYMRGLLIYDVIRVILSSALVFLLVYFFKTAVNMMTGIEKKYVFSNEEVISVAILVGLSLSGLGDAGIFGISIKNLLSVLLILLYSYKFGAGIGSAVGVSMGLMMNFSNQSAVVLIGTYAFCGLMAGLLKNIGKVGTCLGFLAGNVLLTIYLNNSGNLLLYIKEILLAVGIFCLIPNKVIEVISGTFNKNFEVCVDKRVYSGRLKEITVEKLNKFSGAFKELAKTFSEISDTKVVTDKQDISVLFDRVADKVCKNCGLSLHCWDRNFYNTYQVMFKLIEKLENKGSIEEADIPTYFLGRCQRLDSFIQSVNNMYEVFKVDLVWKNKIGESRGVVSKQLEGLSNIISNLALEIDVEICFNKDLEDVVLIELGKNGIRVDECVVFENKWDKMEIDVFHKGCEGVRLCTSHIEKLVSNIVGRKMIKEDRECTKAYKNNTCMIKFVEQELFTVCTGMSKISKNEGCVSGDSHSIINTPDGKCIVVLSDGMGSGYKAATQSRAAVSLLEEFMEAGFDKDTSINLINSILVLKASDDSFATIDMSVIDLYTGGVEFVKIGAAPTFVKKGQKVEAVKSISLPAGILVNIEIEPLYKKLEGGDFIIMMTDGILDSFKSEDGGERNLIALLNDTSIENPQDMADFIMKTAKDKCQGNLIDDMIVIVTKLWKSGQESV